jgi:tetraacyldisaccharide 4'-kinase
MQADSWWLRVVRGEARTPGQRLAAAGLWALSVGYGLALRAHLAGYRLGVARRTRFPALVISIGNLTTGGTGKTTASLAVARWLCEQGRRVAYLSRGYRGAGEREALIVSEGFGPLLPVEAAGDEAYLVSRALPEVFVLVGKDRRRTGALALEKGADALVLDDGFQYQRLERDLDLVLVDALIPFGYDFLLPRGLLREPPSHLARADGVWLTHSDLVRRSDLEALRARVQSLAPGARLWETAHRPVLLRGLTRDDAVAPEAVRGRRVCALSGLGNPLAFERSLERLGAQVVARVRFPDHHPYRADELREVLPAQASRAEWIVTTEKDAVRMPEGDFDKPVWALAVELAGGPGAPALSEELGWLLAAKRNR